MEVSGNRFQAWSLGVAQGYESMQRARTSATHVLSKIREDLANKGQIFREVGEKIQQGNVALLNHSVGKDLSKESISSSLASVKNMTNAVRKEIKENPELAKAAQAFNVADISNLTVAYA
jgi:hypothetical protein